MAMDAIYTPPPHTPHILAADTHIRDTNIYLYQSWMSLVCHVYINISCFKIVTNEHINMVNHSRNQRPWLAAILDLEIFLEE